jgi:Acetyltransferase (GNAT) domain
MVEVGYAVGPAHRRRGYARAALEALLERAAREPRVRTVRATIRLDNAASRALVVQYDFVAVGEQWNDEDGLEIVFEVDANPSQLPMGLGSGTGGDEQLAGGVVVASCRPLVGHADPRGHSLRGGIRRVGHRHDFW